MSELFEPEKLTVEQFMGPKARQKVIPRFQRPFAWSKQQARDFLGDVDAAMQRDEPLYFIGAFLCIKRGENASVYDEIVDGQQRIITMSMIFAAASHLVAEADPALAREQMGISPEKFSAGLDEFLYRDGGLFDDDDSLSDRPYLVEPSENDRTAFQTIVKHGPVASLKTKNKALVSVYNVAKEFFKEQIADTRLGYRYLRNFVKYLTSRVVLVGVFVADEANAYEIFEVLNARGMQLAIVDLIKNKMLSHFARDDARVDKAYEDWQTALAACRERPSKMQEYVRCHIQMRRGCMVEPKKLYRVLADDILKPSPSPDKMAGIIMGDLQFHCQKFSAMLCETDRFWQDGFDSQTAPAVGYLNDYSVVYTIMFSMLYADRPVEFIDYAYQVLKVFMKRTRAVLERFTVLEQYEDGFARLAKQFFDRKAPKTKKDFFSEIRAIDKDNLSVIPDDSFISQVAARPRIGRKDAVDMLSELANYLERREQTIVQVDAAAATLEHIFPQTPNREEWPQFPDKDADPVYLNRLGNLTLLEGKKNTSASNRKFADKQRLVYAPEQCSLRLTNELCDFNEWGPQTIRDRQERLAKLAAEIWAFPK